MEKLIPVVVQFFRIALFKSPPQDLPASTHTLSIALGMSVLVGLVRYLVVGAEYYSIIRVFIEIAVPGGLIYLLLVFFKLPGRFVQTFAAICGSGAIIYMLALPVFPSFHAAAEHTRYDLVVYVIIAIDLWSVAVLAFILKHAVNVGFATGISLAVGLVLLALMLVEGISPSRAPQASDQLSLGFVLPSLA